MLTAQLSGTSSLHRGLRATTVLVPCRFKRTKAKGSALSPQMQRVVTQLNVMSARKKQPTRLKLSSEDLIKHQTIEKSWKVYQDQMVTRRQTALRKQYYSINEAMDRLKELSPALFKAANVDESGKLFPIDLKIPTDYPANKIWYYDYKKTT
ncbi:mitochondrial 54S ribosomal protein mL40 KNAG_0C02860 [Huiozyma naganishii CBS 8797]|uniref:Large ribosomal subunit protein mL40 n=1 Tax=Huiozyma naganishii (strain ATCC MYA-139 / BCRC 22969 / CBS 8797 / KCTC 17520 / NBRC 10181 / NCYC 3082 / Yp74L-3) TaxID=1071383 RepID=J7RWK6_HUIN7|nr:hypothetical protein KNAG_0C02860 [Kazachstania naganishii CBS 8797]CCK69397.1 hypothetical protein KNAG_0C02860 [Kazachstania naganishii CBS 8797]